MSAARRYRLPRERILRGRETFSALFAQNLGLRSGDILFKYRTIERPGPGDVLAAFIVSKKHGNAVRRNRIRRLLREAWRLARPSFMEGMPEGVEVHMALIWIGAPADRSALEFARVRRDLERGLKRIATPLLGEYASQSSS